MIKFLREFYIKINLFRLRSYRHRNANTIGKLLTGKMKFSRYKLRRSCLPCFLVNLFGGVLANAQASRSLLEVILLRKMINLRISLAGDIYYVNKLIYNQLRNRIQERRRDLN